MTQDRQRRAAALWVTSRGHMTRQMCEQKAKEMQMKDELIDRVLGVCLTVFLVALWRSLPRGRFA